VYIAYIHTGTYYEYVRENFQNSILYNDRRLYMQTSGVETVMSVVMQIY